MTTPPPRIFYIPDITNSSSHSGESLRKKSMLGNIRVDVLTSIVVDCLAGKDIEDMDKYDFIAELRRPKGPPSGAP